MHYEITVTKDGKHFFTTSEHSCIVPRKAAEVAFELSERFPSKQGFGVSVAYHPDVSYHTNNVEGKGIEALSYTCAHLGD